LDAGRLGAFGQFARGAGHNQRRDVARRKNFYASHLTADTATAAGDAHRHYQVQQQGLNLGSAFGFQGPLTTISNACASGANAIGHAWGDAALRSHGKSLTGGYDVLCQLTFAGFDSLQALSTTPVVRSTRNATA